MKAILLPALASMMILPFSDVARAQEGKWASVVLEERFRSRVLRYHTIGLDLTSQEFRAERSFRFICVGGWSYEEIVLYRQSEDSGFFSGRWIVFRRRFPARPEEVPSAHRVTAVENEKMKTFLEGYSRILPDGLQGVQEKEIIYSWGDDVPIISFQQWDENGLTSIYRAYGDLNELEEISLELRSLFLKLIEIE